MAFGINTFPWADGLNLAPGRTHHWFQDFQDFGRVRWFLAFPWLGDGGTRSVEISEVYELVKPDDEIQVNVIVRNNGDTVTSYEIWCAEVTGAL